jgi:hypothetical protein
MFDVESGMLHVEVMLAVLLAVSVVIIGIRKSARTEAGFSFYG